MHCKAFKIIQSGKLVNFLQILDCVAMKIDNFQILQSLNQLKLSEVQLNPESALRKTNVKAH